MPLVIMQAGTVTGKHPRERMIESALLLMGRQGVEATSFAQVVEHSGAPRGSIYHHFPGGKAQLVEEATRYAGDLVVRLIDATVERPDDPVAVVEATFAFWRAILHDSDFAAGCPVLAATLAGEHSAGAQDAAREVFLRWEQLYAARLRAAGVPEERARSLAAIAIAAVEGAIVISRAQRSDEPLRRVVDELRGLFRGALAERATEAR